MPERRITPKPPTKVLAASSTAESGVRRASRVTRLDHASFSPRTNKYCWSHWSPVTTTGVWDVFFMAATRSQRGSRKSAFVPRSTFLVQAVKGRTAPRKVGSMLGCAHTHQRLHHPILLDEAQVRVQGGGHPASARKDVYSFDVASALKSHRTRCGWDGKHTRFCDIQCKVFIIILLGDGVLVSAPADTLMAMGFIARLAAGPAGPVGPSCPVGPWMQHRTNVGHRLMSSVTLEQPKFLGHAFGLETQRNGRKRTSLCK